MTSRVHLSRDREQTRRMHHRATRQITDVLAVCLKSTRAKEHWTCLRRDRQRELYAKRSGTSNGSSAYFLAVNEAACSFDEAFELLHFDSTTQFRLMMKLIHGRDFKDGALLSMRTRQHSTSDWTADTQHAAVWFAFQDRRKSVLLREQHFTLFQTLKVFLPDNQQQHQPSQHLQETDQKSVASMSATSSMAGLNARPSDGVHKRTLALSWLPFPESHDSRRDGPQQVDLQYTLIVEEIARNRLRLSCVTSSFHDGNEGRLAGPPWAARAIARRLALRSVGKLEAAVAASRIGGFRLVPPHQWVKNEDRESCVSCWKRFNAVFRRRHHCRLCGEVVCGACSSLRATNTVNLKTKEVQKTRICHLCNNKARVKVSSYTSTDDKYPPQQQTQSQQLPVSPLSVRKLPAGLKVVASHGKRDVTPPSSGQLVGKRWIKTRDGEASDDTDRFAESGGSDGYFGALPDRQRSRGKLISISSITRSGLAKKFWLAAPTSSNKTQLWTHKAASANSVDSSEASSCWEEAYAGLEYSRSFLHPAALAPRSRRPSHPLRITSQTDSYSYADPCLSSPPDVSNGKEREEDEQRRFDHRRTSLMSSNLGLLDQDSLDDSYFLPKLDASREQQRLKLLQVVASPACTLVDRTIMHWSCEVAAAAFGVNAAFIARVDESSVLIEHSIGARGLKTQDELLRQESLCDFVLVQPPHQPLVVLDCLADPRMREIPMVQHLRLRFFIGINICVRGLPIACLCAFGQDGGGNQSEEEEDEGQSAASVYDLSVLEHAARRLEDELEGLLHGLQLS
ncbi:hypothetical protein BBJ28_00000315 [Nothophytophthora sp. Chile5]|nr:hypothetical protein BBJ28_00000315 [Nothophytophthora sp. Chile5]